MPSPRKKIRARRMLGNALNTLGSAPGVLGTLDANVVLSLSFFGDAGPGCIVDGSTTAPIGAHRGLSRSTLLTGLADPNLHSKAVARLEVKSSTLSHHDEDVIAFVAADGTAVAITLWEDAAPPTGTSMVPDVPPGIYGATSVAGVICNINGMGGSMANIATEIAAAINHANAFNLAGGSAKVIATANPGGAGTAFVTLEQQTAGTAGNTTIVMGTDVHSAGTTPTNSQLAVPTKFYGGMGDVATNVTRWYQVSDVQGNVTNVGAVLDASEAMTSNHGLVFSPNGPLAKYIPILENVSNTIEHYGVIRPPSWAANSYCTLRIHGVTAVEDYFYVDGIDSTFSFTVHPELNLNVLASTTGPYGAEHYGSLSVDGVTHFRAGVGGNSMALVFGWERTATGAAALAAYDGWVLRWECGSITYNA